MNRPHGVGWVGMLAVVLGVGTVPEVCGQGLIVDRRPHIPIARSYEVREVSLDASVRDQVADVRISQIFHNPGSIQIDAEYLFPLPEDGAVQNFVLMVDGQELPGKLLPKDEARRIYEDIVRSKRDPALLEYMGRGLYRTSVFPIPPGAERKVTMRYSQICKRDRDVVEFTYPFGTQKFTAKPIHRLALNLRLESRDAIKSVYCPTYDARIDRSGDHDVRVSFEQRNTVPTADFRLVASLAEGAVGASVLSYRPSAGEDGYFLLLASPEFKTKEVRRLPKTVVFVLDKSGSMAGKKIEQARNALRFVLNNLREDDTFNIVTYDDRVETFRSELVPYNAQTRGEAERYVDNIREGGSTNIDSALQTALGMLKDEERPSYVLFLTDGLPTAGETKETAIAEHARSANRSRARLFVFGVGFDVNARLLDRLSGANSGVSEYVKPDDDLETHMARFYSRLTSPVLSGLRVEFDGTDVNRTYPRDVPDLFEGGQLVLAGRYTRSGQGTVRLIGKVGGERKSFEFPVELASSDRGSTHDYVEKLWATRRVGDLIDQIDLHGKNQELINELVALSTRYGLLTPYTSFLADDRVQLHSASNAAQTRENLEALRETTGAFGVAQRGVKQGYLQADRAAAPSFGMMGGMGGGRPAAGQAGAANPAPAPAAPALPGLARNARQSRALSVPARQGTVVAEPEARDEKRALGNLRQVGAKTFYRKGNRWLDSVVTPDEDAKATVLKQFSDAYFELARTQNAEANQYLSFEEAVTVKVNGRVYRIEPAT